MKYNPELKAEVELYKNYIIIVEGQKDVLSLKELGFEKVYALHKNGVSLKERVEQIIEHIGKRDRVCILTDFDRTGKKIYLLVKQILHESGIKIDSSLRGLLLKARVSHVEGLANFMKRVEDVN